MLKNTNCKLDLQSIKYCKSKLRVLVYMKQEQRGTWGSQIGFILAVAGSAVGLANIWRFPYIVGENGGAAFILIYLLSLALIGFPVFLSEILIGRNTEKNPSGAFLELGKSRFWGFFGKMTIFTGFIVSAFYSAVAGWVLGYLVEAILGHLAAFETFVEAASRHNYLMNHPFWGVSFHFLFMCFAVFVLYSGVRSGIERFNKIFMPLLFLILGILVVKGLLMPHREEALDFLFHPNWSALTPAAFLIALGQSFFTLSVGQGTLVTYGSYLGKNESILKSTVPIVLVDTLVSILAAIAVFTIVFSVGMKPDSGPGLIFHTLPLVFSQLSGGYVLSILFFLLVFLAALTSQISAMEPTIAFLIEEKGFKRHQAVWLCGLGAFILGIPCALSTSMLSGYTFFQGATFLDTIMFLASDVLIPLGGFAALILTGWVWGIPKANQEIRTKRRWILMYTQIVLKYIAPLLVILVFLNAIGIL